MILKRLAEKSSQRVQDDIKRISLSEMRKLAEQKTDNTEFLFEKALHKNTIQFICEVKKASPSKGIIAQEFPYLAIAKEYEEAGAAAVSVLTEPTEFLGSDTYLKEIASEIKIPVLRKDFTVDEYQLYQAKALGAGAVLLICSLLDTARIKEYIEICDALKLSALVEAHDEKEIESALDAKARVIGVNNRNLKNFQVDISNSITLRKYVPENVIYVAESGIKTPDDISRLHQANVNAVLIGETFMCAGDKKKMLNHLKGID